MNTDDSRGLLERQAQKQAKRRFTGEPITGFGMLGDDLRDKLKDEYRVGFDAVDDDPEEDYA